jgi:hypothetical protein
MQHTTPVLFPLAFIVFRIDFSRLRWISNAHFKRLSLAAFHPHTLWQGLSCHFSGNLFSIIASKILVYSILN